MRCKKCAASPALLGASAGAAAAAAAGVDRDGLGSGDGGAGLGIDDLHLYALWAQGEGLSIYQVVSSQKSEVSCKLQANHKTDICEKRADVGYLEPGCNA